MKKKSTIDKIKEQFKKMPNKTRAIKYIAEHFEMSPRSVRGNWFCSSGFWSVPEEKQAETLEQLEKHYKTQKKEQTKKA